MKIEDLKKLLIVDSEYYDSNASYVSFFKNNNIKTIDQLIEGKFERGYSNEMRMTSKVYSQVRCLISMLKYKYLGKPLCYDVCLDNKMYLGNQSVIPIFENLNKQERMIILNMFGCRQENVIRAFNMFAKANPLIAVDGFKLIDFFIWIVSNSQLFGKIVTYAKTYIESYEKNQELLNNDYETISSLKPQLESLVATRDELNKQIEDIQEKIEQISYDKSKDSGKK